MIARIIWRVARLTGTSSSPATLPKWFPGAGAHQTAAGDLAGRSLRITSTLPARMICPCCPASPGWRSILAGPTPGTTGTGQAWGRPVMMYPLPKAISPSGTS